MKTLLHISLTEPLTDEAQSIIAQQKQDAAAQVETIRLTTDNAPLVLEKIFAADSICVWPAQK